MTVVPFLKDKAMLDIWSQAYFNEVAGQMVLSA
jgi:hypothetical protein